jgi:hypothetical protein
MNTSKPDPNTKKNSSASIAAAGTDNPDVEMGRSRRSNLDDFLGKFSPSGTEDQEPETQESEFSAVLPPPSFTQGQHYSRPWAVHVDGISETTDAFSATTTTTTNAPGDDVKVEVPSSIASAANSANAATMKTNANTPSSLSSSSDAPPRTVDVQANGDEFLGKRAGKTASAREPSSVVTSDAPPRREPGHQGKFSSTRTPDQDVSRPGDFHVSVEAGPSYAPSTRDWRSSRDEYDRKVAGETASACATAPSSSVRSDAVATGEQGFNKDEFPRQRQGQTASAATPSSSVTSDVPATRDWRSSRDGYGRKVAGESASATTPSSLATPDAPMTERGYGLGEFPDDFSSSATEDQEPEAQESELSAVPPPSFTQGQHYSRPGAVHVDGISETTDAFSVTMPSDSDQMPEIHQSRENTQGEYLAEANLVLEPDLVFGEPLEEPQAYWSYEYGLVYLSR